jgi:myo-inositol 2-dehydrogenase / D-chiro-inositol 1-dehydrogenase
MTKIKVGMVGLGRLGAIHAENIAFALRNTTLSALCSLDEQELANASRTLNVNTSACYRDFDHMIEKESLDAVVIASSSGQHCQQVKRALERGLHVFCEKPLGVTVGECRDVESAVEKYAGQVFMLGFMRRYDASYQYARKKIEEGYIGRPILFRGYSVDPLQAIAGYLKYAKHSAGQFLDMAVHDIDMARWLLKSEPSTVYAIGGAFEYPEVEAYGDGDNVSALMQFKNQAMVFLLAGRTASHGYNIETEIIGTKATLRIGAVPQANLVEILDHSGVRHECSQSFPERFGQAFKNELQEFIDCIVEKRKPEVSVYDGTRATEIAIAATESFKNRTLLKF